ncbi:glycine--tRNA ligase subunit beta [Thermocrinis sp.]
MKLLVEVGTEELPANVINQALSSLKENLERVLGVSIQEVYGTPRRLAVITKDFEDKPEEKEELIYGPPLSIAYEDGKPTKALLGFLERVGASLDSVMEVQRGGGKYVAVKRLYKDKSPLERLKEEFEKILLSIPLPKRMRWNSSGLTFSRPIRWICALYGDRIVPLNFGKLKASNLTFGHRFLSEGPILIQNPEEYEEKLKEHWVIPRFKERLGLILEMLREESYALKGVPEYPEGLPEEVANLLEFPFSVVGKFEEKYLELPEKVLVTVLAHHQRFFCIANEEGRLIPYFIAFSNNKPTDKILKGYQTVIRARLEDALFFYKEDLKIPLESLVEGLKGVIFHPKAGNMWEKTQRLVSLSERIARMLGFDQRTVEKVKRAALLSKADLLTNMVRELDELQGYMGMVYARAWGEDEEVARAIYEHYFPRTPSDEVPESPLSQVLSIADKLDNLYTLIKAGEIPSGSSDPYGLRRNAYGIFAIIHKHHYNLALKELLEDLPEGFEEFIRSRLEAYLEPYGYDVVRAVLEVKDPLKPYEIIRLTEELANLKHSQKFKDIVEAYKRVVKILPSGWDDSFIEEGIMQEDEEKVLWEKVKSLETERLEVLDLWDLKQPIDMFFDKVLVMDKDLSLRRNRLALLYRVKKLFNRFADFEKIVFEQPLEV